MSRFICIFVVVLCIVVPTTLVSVDAAERRCPLTSVHIDQIATGKVVESKTEWKVKITSQCFCTLTQLTLFCPKFHSGIEVSPPVISIDSNGHCIVNTPAPIHPGESVVFTYAWNPIDFKTLTFDEACS